MAFASTAPTSVYQEQQSTGLALALHLEAKITLVKGVAQETTYKDPMVVGAVALEDNRR